MTALSWKYRPFEELDETPHVMVDGEARRSSVVTLSHWPASPTPCYLARDLSTESCFSFLALAGGSRRPPRRSRPSSRRLVTSARSAGVVTCDHFDEDGLLGLFVLSEPEAAGAAKALVVAAARCGDFGVVSFEEAAMVAFSIAPLATREAGPAATSSERYGAVLPRLGHLLAAPSSHGTFYEEELAAFRAGVEALDKGDVVCFEEDDLVVVRRSGTARGRIPGACGGLPVHKAAVHTASGATRVLAFDGDRCELYFRYEGWVRYVTARVSLRCDLSPLAEELSALEPGAVRWEASGPASLVPRLHPAGEGRTELDPGVVRERVSDYLSHAPPAFDPWAAAPRERARAVRSVS